MIMVMVMDDDKKDQFVMCDRHVCICVCDSDSDIDSKGDE